MIESHLTAESCYRKIDLLIMIGKRNSNGKAALDYQPESGDGWIVTECLYLQCRSAPSPVTELH